MRCYARTIKLIAGNNVYVNQESVELHGINIGIVAGQDIHLPIGFQLDTTGLEGISFEKSQGYGKIEAADKLKKGEDGEDGLDGFCGDNAGHIYIKAEREIVNIEKIAKLKFNGGDGAVGQIGGCGQKGGCGENTGDAEAENIGSCVFSPGFSAAFARQPGLNPKTGLFEIESELSGNGGNAGRVGFGGQGGIASELFIKDNESWLKNKKEDKESFDSSDNLKVLVEKLKAEKELTGNQGKTRESASFEGAVGGEEGEPGSYGSDNIIYVDGLFSHRKNIKGDYSNYLLEESTDKSGKKYYDKNKYKTKSILVEPDLYAQRSASYDVFTSVAIVGVVAAASIIVASFAAFAAAVLPVIGIAAGVVAGATLNFALTMGSVMSLVGAAGFLSYRTTRGLSVDIGDKNKMKACNRAQIKFNNRYCDEKALRNEKDARKNPRVDARSRGKKGEDSKMKEESEREEHSKSKETENEFADAYKMAKLSRKANKLKNDNAKEECIDSLNSELKNIEQECKSCESTLNVLFERVEELSSKFSELSGKMNENESKKREIEQQIDKINSLLNAQENQLSTVQQNMLDQVEFYLKNMDKQISARIKLEFGKIKLESKQEVLQKLKEVFYQIKAALYTENQVLDEEKTKIENEIESKKNKKNKKQEEIELMRNQELKAIKNRVNSEKEVAALEAMQKRLKDERQKEKSTSTVEEVVSMKEFKMEDRKKIECAQHDENKLNFADIKWERKILNEELYKGLFKKSLSPLATKYADFNTLKTTLYDYSLNSSINPDLIFAQLDFVINACHLGVYEHIKAEIKSQEGDSKTKENEYKKFKSYEMFESFSRTPFVIEHFYKIITKFYFRKMWPNNKSYLQDVINGENVLVKCSLEVHYEGVESKLSNLEKELLVYALKLKDDLRKKENFFHLRRLLNNYKTMVDNVGKMEQPAVGITDSNINRFYMSVILSIRNSFEVEEAKKSELWPLMDELLSLIELINAQLREIDQIELWKGLGIMASQKTLLTKLIGNFKFVKDNKIELDNFKANKNQEINVYKIELIEECLQYKLIDVLLKKEEIDEYNSIKKKVLESKIVKRQDKDEFLFEIKSVTISTRNFGISNRGFMHKYAIFLSLDSTDQFGFDLVLARILKNIQTKSEKTLSTILKDYVYLLQEKKAWTYEELFGVYSNLTPKLDEKIAAMKFFILLLGRIEMILSDRLENLIKGKLSTRNNLEFEAEFATIVKLRVKGVEGDISEVSQRKSAFYKQINELLSKSKEENEDELVTKATLLLVKARGGLGDRKFRDFFPKEIEFFTKIKCKSNDFTQNPSFLFEEALFNISQMQYDVIHTTFIVNNTSMSEVKKKMSEKLKILESNLTKTIKEISSMESDNMIIVAMKNYLKDLEKTKMNKERAERLAKKCKENNQGDFLKSFKELKTELHKEDAYLSSLHERLLEISKSALSEHFKQDFSAKNAFIFSTLAFYDSQKKDNLDDFIYNLIDFIDTEELIRNQNYDKLVECLNDIKSLSGLPNKESQSEIVKIENIYKDLCKDLVTYSDDLIKETNETNLLLILQALIEIGQNASNEEIKSQTFYLLDDLFKKLTEYQTQTKSVQCEKDGKEKEKKTESQEIEKTEEKKENNEKEKTKEDENVNEVELQNQRLLKIKRQFVKEIVEAIEKSLGDHIFSLSKTKLNKDEEFAIGTLKFIKSWIQSEEFRKSNLFQNYLVYLKMRVDLKEETFNINCLKKESLEPELIEISKTLKNMPNCQDNLTESVELAIEILDESYMQEIIRASVQVLEAIEMNKRKYIRYIEEILKTYQNLIDTKAELVKKGRINFVRELIHKFHRHKARESLSVLEDTYNKLKIEIKSKTSYKEIENYLIDKVNSLALIKLTELITHDVELKELKELKDSLKNLSVNDVFKFLFGDSNQKGEKCFLKQFVQVLVDEQKSKEKMQDKEPLIVKHVRLTRKLLIDLNFNCFEQQERIDELRKELIFYFDNYLFQNQDKTDLAKVKVALNDLFSLKCFKTNNFLKYVDRKLVELSLMSVNKENYELLDQIECLFLDINFSQGQKTEKIPKTQTKWHFVDEIKTNLEGLNRQISLCNENEIKFKLITMKKNIKDYMRNNEAFRLIDTKRNEVMEIIQLEEQESKFFDLKLEELSLIPKFELFNLLENYSKQFNSNLKTYLESCNVHSRLTKQLVNINKHIANLRDPKTRLFSYLAYSKQFSDIKKAKTQILNSIGEKVLLKVNQCQISVDFVNKTLENMKTYHNWHIFNFSELNKNLNLHISLLTTDKMNKIDITAIIGNVIKKIKFKDNFGKQLANDFITFNSLIFRYFEKNCNYDQTLTMLMNRLIKMAEKKMQTLAKSQTDKELKEIFAIFEIFLNTDATSRHPDVMEKVLRELEFDVLVEGLLEKEELLFSKYLSQEVVKQLLKEKMAFLWKDSLENEYIACVSESILTQEKEVLEKKAGNNVYGKKYKELTKLIRSLYYDECQQAFDRVKVNIDFKSEQDFKALESLNSIKIFKDYLIMVKELILNSNEAIDLFEAIKSKKSKEKIDLKESTEILMYSRLFGNNLNDLIKMLLNDTVKDLMRQVLLGALGNLLVETFHINEKQKEAVWITETIYKNLQNNSTDFIKLLIDKVQFDHVLGLRYEQSEVELLKRIIEMCVQIGIYYPDKMATMDKLEAISLLKWNRTLRLEMIKYELNSEDEELVKDILCIEQARGTELTNRFISIIKNVQIQEILVKFIAKKFKKNEWELSLKALDLMKGHIDAAKWVNDLNEFYAFNKRKTLSPSELIDEMKKLEGIGEINSNVKELLNRNEDNLCLLEMCLSELTKMYKSASTINAKLGKNICDYDEKDIKEWMKSYKEVNKVELKSIYCNEVFELVLVISRASKIVNGYQLRYTQQIAMLLFIDSMLFHVFNGRLANISTGEGKSIIIISTAIAQLLIRGGNVDILTSSEVLAERDAEESQAMFGLFDISVSNNCDAEVNSNEKLRKERYEKNTVIYGEIGHFQRDILLTKYYEKDIRSKLATCLIIDEVDSMCIDNMCNTLYISHQIADLRYLKELYCFIWQAVNMKDTNEYTMANVEKVEKFIQKIIKEKQVHFPSNLEEFIQRRLTIWINNAYVAKDFIEEGNHYSIMGSGSKIGEAVINDLQTGVEQMNTQWSEGLQQFIQLKHTNKLNEESLKAIFMSNYIFITQYGGNIYGMTGTLGGNLERDLLNKAYNLDFFQLPRFKKDLNIREEERLVSNRVDWLEEIKKEVNRMISANRIIEPAEIEQAQQRKSKLLQEIRNLEANIANLTKKKEKESQTELEKNERLLELEDLNDVIGESKDRNRNSRAVLIICQTKKDVNDIVKVLLVKHKNLYDYNGKLDGLRKVESVQKRVPIKIKQLRPEDIIVATNVAGRGTDFKISRLLEENGGLHVILSYLPQNIRVELQAFGRSARKGENGSGRIILYDSGAKQSNINIEFMREERDEREEKRLQDIRVKMIPRVTLERELFLKFDSLQENLKKNFSQRDIKYRQLQLKSLHNKWAFWLDKMSHEINNVYQAETNKKAIFTEFDEFVKEMNKKAVRSYRGIEGLVDEPGELIKLAKYNIEEGNFRAAIWNCDYIINHYGANLDPFAYYYKTIALFQPLKDNDWDQVIESYRKKLRGHILNYEEKVKSIDWLKKSAILFEEEIERIQNKSYIISTVGREKANTGIGSAADFFTKSNMNEIAALQVHLNSVKSAVSQEIVLADLAQSFKTSKITEQEAKEILESVLKHESMQRHLNKERFSTKIKIRVHISNKKEDEEALKTILGEVKLDEMKSNAEEYAKQENITEPINFVICEKLSEDQEKTLCDKQIELSCELYTADRVNGSYKHLKLPGSLNYCKNKMLKYLQEADVLVKSSDERENLIEAFKYHYNINCLTVDKIWAIFVNNIGLEVVQCFVTNTNKNELKEAFENGDLWNDKVFEEKGNTIKTLLKTEFEKCDALTQDEFANLIKIDKNADQMVKRLVEGKYLLEQQMFKFKQASKQKIEEYIYNKIFLKGTITIESLKKVKLNNLERLRKIKPKLDELVLKQANEKVIKAEDVMNLLLEKELDINVIGKKNAYIGFQLFKKILILNGLAINILEHLGIPLGTYENKEISKIENLIDKMYDSKYFNKDMFELDVENILKIFRNAKVIRGLKLKMPLMHRPESISGKNSQDLKDYFVSIDHRVKELREMVKRMIKCKVTAKIQKMIDDGKFMSDEEVEEQRKRLTFWNTVHWTISTKFEKNKKRIIEEKGKEEIDKLTNSLASSIVDTMGLLKSLDMSMVDYKKLDIYFRGTNIPREALEYGILSKDMVLTLTEYQSPWCWKAFVIAVWGIEQMALGALLIAYPVFGAFSLHFGSFLISEGTSDVIYAIQNAGNIMFKNFATHKALSVVISLCCVGVGAYLSKGATAANVFVEMAESEASSIFLRQISKESGRLLVKTIFKKITGELAKALLGTVQSIVSNFFGSLMTEAIFNEFKDTIISKIQNSHEYLQRKESLERNLNELKVLIDKPSTIAILNEKFYETELEMNDKLNNKIMSLTGQISGPLASQIGEAADNTQYSGLEFDAEKGLTNKQSKRLGQIAQGISIAIRVLNFSNTLLELVFVVNDFVRFIDKKIKFKLEAEQRKKSSSKHSEKMDSQELMNIIDTRIFDNLQRKVQNGIVTPTFNIVLNHALKPLYKKLEKALMSDFNELKKRSLAYGENNKRFEENKEEKGTKYNAVKEFLLRELNLLVTFKSPITQVDLEKILKSKDLKLTIQIDGKDEVLDMSKEENRNRIRDFIGSIGLRILPGSPPRISRPNYSSYLKALLESGKQLNKFDLKLIADKEKRPIQFIDANGNPVGKQIGPQNGKEPLYFKQEEGDTKFTGNFSPMVKNSDGIFTQVENLPNKDNKCGVETVIYLTQREKLIAQGCSPHEADTKAREYLANEKNDPRQAYLQEVFINAIRGPHLYESYVGRSHERSVNGNLIIGGGTSHKRPLQSGAENRLTKVSKRRMNPDNQDKRKLLLKKIKHSQLIHKCSKSKTEKICVKINSKLDNKLLFEALQQFHNLDTIQEEDETKAETEQDKENVKPASNNQLPLNVEMKIGSGDDEKGRVFQLQKAARGVKQIFVLTLDEDYAKDTKKSGTYEKIVKDLESTEGYDVDEETKKLLIKQRATLISVFLEGNQFGQKKWENEKLTDEQGNYINDRKGKQINVMNSQQIRSAVELIAITQVAEAAPPEKAYFDKLVNEISNDNDFKEIIRKSGRVPGNDKYARAAIKAIATGEASFSKIFNKSDGDYIPARDGGTDLSRRMLSFLLHEEDAHDLLDKMSESSEDVDL